MTIAPGSSLNSGAGLVTASGIPIMAHNSMLAFNETQFGFVPHAGSSYYMSRLPGEFGTFLQLTGFPVSGKDAIKMGIADGMVDHLHDHEFHMQDVITSMDPSSMMTAAQHRHADSFGLFETKQVENAVIER